MTDFNLLDGVFLVIIATSTLLAFWKGFIAQAISLAGWVATLVAARIFGEQAATLFETLISDPGLRLAAGYITVALVVFLAAKVMSAAAGSLVQKIGLGKLDRLLGLAFGALRGLMIIVLGVAVVSLTDFREHSLWQESQLMPYMEQVRDFSAKHLDAYMQEREADAESLK